MRSHLVTSATRETEVYQGKDERPRLRASGLPEHAPADHISGPSAQPESTHARLFSEVALSRKEYKSTAGRLRKRWPWGRTWTATAKETAMEAINLIFQPSKGRRLEHDSRSTFKATRRHVSPEPFSMRCGPPICRGGPSSRTTATSPGSPKRSAGLSKDGPPCGGGWLSSSPRLSPASPRWA
jgi:hypothetical protein